MKHIFLVHSAITYWSSFAVINHLNIDKTDAIIVFVRFKKIEDKNNRYQAVSLDEYYAQQNIVKKIVNFFRYFNIPQRIDRLVNAFTNNEPFMVYLPVLLLIGKSLITHPNCKGFHFIEEGTLNYYTEENLNNITTVNSKDPWRTSLLKNFKQVLKEMYMILRGYNFRLHGLPFTYSCYTGMKHVLYFGLTTESFPLAPPSQKVVIPFSTKNFEADYAQKNINLNKSIIWIGDAAVQTHGYSEKLYLEGIQKGCIEFMRNKNADHIFLKFHRDETTSMRRSVEHLFYENKIRFTILPDETIMELMLFNSTQVTLIGVYSSLLYYAAIMGHESLSIYEFVNKDYSKLFKNLDLSFYWSRVARIQLNHEIAYTSLLQEVPAE